MDDIKRALEQIYATQRQVDEAPSAAVANLSQAADLKGTFNAKAFATLLGMDANEAMQLASFVNKHKRGTLPARSEIMAAADVFRALIDAAPQTVNQAMVMLRKITAESVVSADEVNEATLYGTPDEYKKQLELIAKQEKALPPGISAARKQLAIKKQEIQKKHNAAMGFKEEAEQVEENLRLTKEGLDECWTDMTTNGAPSRETMTVSISMPNKNISVTTDSAEELMNVLKLAGIEVNSKQDSAAEVGQEETTWTPPLESDEPIPVVVKNESDVSSDESSNESAKPDFLDVDKDGNEEESWEDAEDDKEKAKNESVRILALAGLDESKLANSPAGTSMDEPTEYDSLPSEKGTGAGKPDYGTRQSNMGGENPMAVHTLDLEESFQKAMGEYRKFVAEKIGSKK